MIDGILKSLELLFKALEKLSDTKTRQNDEAGLSVKTAIHETRLYLARAEKTKLRDVKAEENLSRLWNSAAFHARQWIKN
jgi:hypothetical protein